MISQGQTGTYVSATGPIDLPRPKRRKHRPARQRHVCPDCDLPLVRPGAFHVCLDLSAPEPVIAKVAKAKRTQSPRSADHAANLAAAQRQRWAERRASQASRDAEIIARYATGEVGISSIASEFGIGRETVRRILVDAGVEIRKPGATIARSNWKTALTDEQHTEAADLYRSGETTEQIAKRYNVSPSTVNNALRRSGITLRPSGGRKGYGRVASLGPDLAARYVTGESIKSIAASIGASPNAVRMVVRDQGVTIRSSADEQRGKPGKALRVWSDAEIADVARCYEAGMSINNIARRHSSSDKTIRPLLEAQGITIRPRGGQKKRAA